MDLYNAVFKTLLEKIWTKIKKISAQDPKRIKKTFPEVFLLTRKRRSDNTAQKLMPEGCKFLPQVPKVMRKLFFHKQMILLKMFIWTRKTQFRQPRQRNFEKNWKIFRSMSKNDIKRFFRGKILHKISPWTRENIVDSPAKELLLGG